LKNTPENNVKREVKDWLSAMGFFHYPNIAGIGSHPGIPDRVAIKKGVVLFIEVKAPHGTQSGDQRKFQAKIENSDGHYILARGYEDIEKYIQEKKLWELLPKS
jgi:hypothetical protein